MAKRIKVKAPETWDEFLAYEWDQFNCHYRDYHPTPANYIFKPGEEVAFGSMEECRVEATFPFNGMEHCIVLLSYHDRGSVYGKPFDNKRRLPRLTFWFNVDPVSTVTDTDFGRDRINTDYSQTSLDSLIHMAYSRGLIDSPEYQRDYVWTLQDKQRLIKSIFDRMDIGKFILLEREYPENRLEIIDGKQRFNAILGFYEGRYEYEGKTWFQLSWRDKQRFTDIMVHTAKIQESRVKKSDILWLFLAINRGGVPQTEEHIAKARRLYEEALKEEANAKKK